jgi:hypothetical protein
VQALGRRFEAAEAIEFVDGGNQYQSSFSNFSNIII